MHIFVLGGIVMKRKFVLMVPIAAVTLWANSFGVLVNAQDFNEVKGQANGTIWQQADQNKDNQAKANQANRPNVAAPINYQHAAESTNNQHVVAPTNNQQDQVKPGDEPGAQPVNVVKDNNQQKVTADTKEKRKVALAKDYEQRKASEVKKVKPEDKKPLPPKKETNKPAPVNPEKPHQTGIFA